MILSIIGTRPQYVKLSAIQSFCIENHVQHAYIDTGQHYDQKMSQIFVDEYKISSPLAFLRVDNRSAISQIASGLSQLEGTLKKLSASCILVYGDTNSTLIGALCARKMNIPLAHIESGVRSFNFHQPEEINRKIVDHLSNLLFAPTKGAENNLRKENAQGEIVLSGDLSVEIIQNWKLNWQDNSTLHKDDPNGEYLVVTLHRPHNVDDKATLARIFALLGKISKPLLLLAHPRLQSRLHEFSIKIPRNIDLKDPVGHMQLLKLISNSRGVITDSGTIQKEAYLLKVLCTTLGKSTEWPETAIYGWNILFDTEANDFLDAVVSRNRPPSQNENIFGRGDSAKNIVEKVLSI